MRAAVWYGARDIRVEEYPNPSEPKKGEIQVAIAWAGICGTDLHEYSDGPVFIPWEKPHPLTGHSGPTILGHEMSGTVVAVGEGVTGFELGDRVVPDIVLYCGTCHLCRQGKYVLCVIGGSLGLQTQTGGFGRLVNMPAYTAYKLPASLSLETGAMIEPLATAIRGIRQAKIVPGDRVAIVGGGTIGMFALQAVKLCGARETYMVTRGEKKLEIAGQLGATAILNSNDDPVTKVLEHTRGEGVEVVLECAGTPDSANLSLKLAGKTGRIVLMGIFPGEIKYDINELVFFEKEVYGSLGRSPVDMRTAIGYLQHGLVRAEPLITKKIDLEDIVKEGFETLMKERNKHIKILVSVNR